MWSSRMFSLLVARAPAAARVKSSNHWCCRKRNIVTPAIATTPGVNNSFVTDAGTKNPNLLSQHLLTNNPFRPFHDTRRCMSKYLSKSATKRLPLNTKRAKKGYYKGKGGTSEGRLTSKGKFIANPLKQLQLIVPDLTGFPLKPYIARTVPKSPPEKRASVVPGQ